MRITFKNKNKMPERCNICYKPLSPKENTYAIYTIARTITACDDCNRIYRVLFFIKDSERNDKRENIKQQIVNKEIKNNKKLRKQLYNPEDDCEE